MLPQHQYPNHRATHSNSTTSGSNQHTNIFFAQSSSTHSFSMSSLTRSKYFLLALVFFVLYVVSNGLFVYYHQNLQQPQPQPPSATSILSSTTTTTTPGALPIIVNNNHIVNNKNEQQEANEEELTRNEQQQQEGNKNNDQAIDQTRNNNNNNNNHRSIDDMNIDEETPNSQSSLLAYKSDHQLHIVLVNSPLIHHTMRRLVGSIHRFSKGSVKIIMYGFRLPLDMKSEIQLWRGVTLIDMESHFLTSTRSELVQSKNSARKKEDKFAGEGEEGDKGEKNNDVGDGDDMQKKEDLGMDEKSLIQWKPLVLNDALDRADNILYLDTRVVMTSHMPLAELNEYLNSHGGSLFFYVKNMVIDNDETQLDENCLIGAPVILMRKNCFAHRHYLMNLIECSKRYCTREELKFLNSLKKDSTETTRFDGFHNEMERESVTCHKADENVSIISMFVRRYDEKLDYYLECDVIMRDDLLSTRSQLPHIGTHQRSDSIVNPDKGDQKVIAVGFPSTTKGNKSPTVRNNPVITVLLPGFLRTVPRKGAPDDKYHYILYLGYDEGDSFYDVGRNREELLARVKVMIHQYSVDFHMIRCVNSHGWVPFVWNVLFQHSMDDGADYFYQMNDDNRLVTPGWSDQFVNTLSSSSIYPNLGVTGPVDLRNKKIFTQAFVHRTHYEIFGFLFPSVFKNWFSDNWITYVYEFDPVNASYRNTEIHAANKQTYGTRYTICEQNGKKNLDKAMSMGQSRIRAWLEDHK